MNTVNAHPIGFRSVRERQRAIARGAKRELAGNRMARHMEDLGKWADHLGMLAKRILAENRRR